MKNIENYRLIKTIAMEIDDFAELVEKLTDGLATVEYEFGAYISDTDKADEIGVYWNEDMTVTLSKYFDVNVTSWHSDTCDYPMVFICYKEWQ